MYAANDNKNPRRGDTFAAFFITCQVLFCIGGVVGAIWSSPWWLLFALVAFALLLMGVA